MSSAEVSTISRVEFEESQRPLTAPAMALRFDLFQLIFHIPPRLVSVLTTFSIEIFLSLWRAAMKFFRFSDHLRLVVYFAIVL
jgi:hypothetical protein